MTTDPLRVSASPPRATGSGSRAVFERGLDTTSGLGFVRERLALLAKTLFLVSFGFYLFLLASMVLIGGARSSPSCARPSRWDISAPASTMAVLWLLASRARLSVAEPRHAGCRQLHRGRWFSLAHDDRGRGADSADAAGADGHRDGPRHPDALQAGAHHVAFGPGLRSDRRRVHRAPSPHGVPARVQPGLSEAAHDASTPSSGASWGPRWRPSSRGSCTDCGSRSPRRPSWGSTCWRRRSAGAGWARCGARATAC